MKVKCSEAIILFLSHNFVWTLILKLERKQKEEEEALNTASRPVLEGGSTVLYPMSLDYKKKKIIIKTHLFVLWNLYTFNSNRREP